MDDFCWDQLFYSQYYGILPTYFGAETVYEIKLCPIEIFVWLGIENSIVYLSIAQRRKKFALFWRV